MYTEIKLNVTHQVVLGQGICTGDLARMEQFAGKVTVAGSEEFVAAVRVEVERRMLG